MPARDPSTRCFGSHLPLYARYHDEEWGVPVRDERRLFELLVLEGAQAGLSWETVLKKREGYRAAFAGFDPEAVARFTPARVARILRDPGIVRHRLKVEGTVRNARAWLRLREEAGPVADHLWSFPGGTARRGRRSRRRCRRTSAAAASPSWARRSATPSCRRSGW